MQLQHSVGEAAQRFVTVRIGNDKKFSVHRTKRDGQMNVPIEFWTVYWVGVEKWKKTKSCFLSSEWESVSS
jgi:hypothetical protein